MKKYFVFFTAALLAACLLASCSKKEAADLPPEKQTHLTIHNETGETIVISDWRAAGVMPINRYTN
jgi:hypothetical protein